MAEEHPFLDPETLRRLPEAMRINPRTLEMARKAIRIDPATLEQARAAFIALDFGAIAAERFRLQQDALSKLGEQLRIDDSVAQLLSEGVRANRAAIDEALERFNRAVLTEGFWPRAREGLGLDDPERRLLSQRLEAAAAGAEVADDVLPSAEATTYSLSELAGLYRELPDDRRQDVRDKSAGTAVVIGRYVDALLERDDLGNAGWVLLQVLVCLLVLHSSVTNAIDALETKRKNEQGAADGE